MPFFRAGFVCPTPPFQSLAREQINALTSFLDASLVYGSEPDLASRLRNLSSPLGLLAVNQEVTDLGLPYLPFDSKKPSPCEFIDSTARVPCFVAGKSRLGPGRQEGLGARVVIWGPLPMTLLEIYTKPFVSLAPVLFRKNLSPMG